MTDMKQILIALCSPMMVTVLCPTSPMRGCIDKSSGVNENFSPQPASQLGASSNEFGRNGSDLFSKLKKLFKVATLWLLHLPILLYFQFPQPIFPIARQPDSANYNFDEVQQSCNK